MPTYEYECQACHHKFEEFQSITAKPIKKCPSCGKLKVHRLISSGAGFIFKGSGFYITDYRSEQYKDAQKADTAPAAPSDTKSETKSDAKTDAPKTPAATETKSVTPAASDSKPAAPSKPAPSAPSKKSASPSKK